MKEIEVTTKFPTPQDFFEFVEQFSNRIAERDGTRWLRFLFQEPKRQPSLDSSTPPITAFFGADIGQKVFATWTNKDNRGVGKIVAQAGPKGTTILFVSATDSVWQKVKPSWELLCTEMERQGWIGASKLAASSVAHGQAEAEPNKESDRKRIFGLRIDYLIVGILLGILISVASLFLSPEWARSNLTLVILFPVAFAAATAFIANFRKAFE